MLDFLKNLEEVKGFGWNVLIFSSLMTVILSGFQAWGLYQQGKKIWKEKSGKSISVSTILYGFFYFLAFFFYGFSKNSAAMMLNGLLGLSYIQILLGLLKFKGFSKNEWRNCFYFALFIPAMILLPFKDELLVAGLVGVLLSQLPQLRELYKTKSPGVVEPKFIIIFMITNVFWFIYAITIGNKVLYGFNPLSFLLLTTTLILWFRYKKLQATT